MYLWKLHISGSFTVKSMYSDLGNDNLPFHRKFIWKLKVPLKKIFMWYLSREAVFTKHNLAKHHWNGKKYSFCDWEETIQHLFISYPFARLMWRVVFIAFNLLPPTSISNMFGNWLVGLIDNLRLEFEWEYVLYVGLFGFVVMILFLTTIEFPISCGLSIWLRHGSVRGPHFSVWRRGTLRSLGATTWRR